VTTTSSNTRLEFLLYHSSRINLRVIITTVTSRGVAVASLARRALALP